MQIHNMLQPTSEKENKDWLLKQGLKSVRTWMKANVLKLSEEKTEIIMFTPKYQPAVEGMAVSIKGAVV